MDEQHMRAGLRLQDVMRWNMVRTSRNQSVMEHSAAVAFIAARLAVYMGKCPRTAAYYGLIHDIDESVTGDIPSHVKRKVRDEGFDINDLSNFDAIPAEFKTIVKLADRIESVFWLAEYRSGSHANWVMADLQGSYTAMLESLTDDYKAAAVMVWTELNRDVKPDFSFKGSARVR